MGRQGARPKKRKRTQHLPKVRGVPGQLWDGDSPITYEGLERSVGRAGPKAQAQYFGRHKGALVAARFVGIAMLAAVVAAIGIAVLLR